MANIRVSIVEDERMVLQSLRGLMDVQAGLAFHTSAHSVEGFLDIDGESPEVILLDIGLEGTLTGLEGIRPIKERHPSAEIIMLTTFDDSDRIFKALCAGASAYLTKRTPFAQIVEAIQVVNGGGSYMSPGIARKVVDYFAPKRSDYPELTPRQHQIAEGIVDGLSYKLIADKLMITTETVRDHIKKIYKKLEVNSKTELIKRKHEGGF